MKLLEYKPDVIIFNYYFKPVKPLKYIKVKLKLKRKPQESEWFEYEK